jgi:hypothetical protein
VSMVTRASSLIGKDYHERVRSSIFTVTIPPPRVVT